MFELLTLNKFRICIRNRKLFKTFKLLYFQLAIISRLTSLLKDFQVGILLQSYYRANSIKISKKSQKMAWVNVRLHSAAVIGVEKNGIASCLQFDNEVENERSYIEQFKLLKHNMK